MEINWKDGTTTKSVNGQVVTQKTDIMTNQEFNKKNEIEKIFIQLITNIGIDIPSNFEDIAQFIYEDVCETADKENWNDDDIAIGFRRWIESNIA